MPSIDALAKNEELFRNVNERIEEVSAGVPRDQPLMDFLCECDRNGCEEKVQAARAEYEAVRARPTQFIVVPGHEDRRVERVISTNDRFTIVEKQGQAATDAEQTDPRSTGGA
jgi:hypothetical protein